jgi:hypothetical protein
MDGGESNVCSIESLNVMPNLDVTSKLSSALEHTNVFGVWVTQAGSRNQLTPLLRQHRFNLSQRGVFDDVSREGKVLIFFFSGLPLMAKLVEDDGHDVSIRI